MPPKLKPLPSKRPPQQKLSPEDDELTIGNIKVGPNGVEFFGEGEFHVPRPDLNLSSLRRVCDLGHGTQGNVAMYISSVDNTAYAVKKIAIAPLSDKRIKQTVAGELRNIFTQKTNEYTVALYNAFCRGGALRLVMEYMDWGNVEELMKQRPVLSEPICAYIASEVLHALEILHTKSSDVIESAQKDKRQIHRDIKPANILLSCSGRVKLADFGIATSAETIGVNSFVGTATYMSPERIQGRMYSTPGDIWSVGVVVAELLTGKYPFPSVQKGFMALLLEITSVETLELAERYGCSAEAESFVNSCLGQEPESRSSATELLRHPWLTTRANEGQKELIALLLSLGDPNQHKAAIATSSGRSGQFSGSFVQRNSDHSVPKLSGSVDAASMTGTILPSSSAEFRMRIKLEGLRQKQEEEAAEREVASSPVSGVARGGK